MLIYNIYDIYMQYVSLFLYMYVFIYMICENRQEDFLHIIIFGVNILRWCPFIHLFDTSFQNSPFSKQNKRNNNNNNHQPAKSADYFVTKSDNLTSWAFSMYFLLKIMKKQYHYKGVTGCYYKEPQVLQSVTDCYFKVCQTLQGVTVITSRG